MIIPPLTTTTASSVVKLEDAPEIICAPMIFPVSLKIGDNTTLGCPVTVRVSGVYSLIVKYPLPPTKTEADLTCPLPETVAVAVAVAELREPRVQAKSEVKPEPTDVMLIEEIFP